MCRWQTTGACDEAAGHHTPDRVRGRVRVRVRARDCHCGPVWSAPRMRVLSLNDTAQHAAKTFRLFEPGPPNLIPFGLRGIDDVLGGDEPGQLSVLAGLTGLGKSRSVLAMCMSTGDGYCSLEDGAASIGARVLAWQTGLDSLAIRRKALRPGELKRLELACSGKLALEREPRIVDCVAGSLEMVEDAISALAQAGCKRVWIDYLTKIRGLSEDRRNEVGTAMTRIHRRCVQEGVAAGLVCQFKRVQVWNGQIWLPAQKWNRPQRSWLKESGDIENEARTILFLYQASKTDTDLILEVDKASYGGEGAMVRMRVDASGMLREVSPPGAGDL